MEKPKRPLGLRKRAQKRLVKNMSKMLKEHLYKMNEERFNNMALPEKKAKTQEQLEKAKSALKGAIGSTSAGSIVGGAMSLKSNTIDSKKNKK